MARASQIYIVHPKDRPGEVLAAFTVKYESQNWAERNGGLDDLERYRLRDGDASGKVPCPWEEE